LNHYVTTTLERSGEVSSMRVRKTGKKVASPLALMKAN
jgi:hypothetical protein